MTRAVNQRQGSSGNRGAGRPRDPAVERQILDAARRLLAQGGVSGLTVEGVAVEAGVGKPTIYRRYRAKNDLALAVLVDMVEQAAPVPDSGDTRTDMIAFVSRAIEILSTTVMGRIMQGLVSDLAADDELARAFRAQVLGARAREVRQLLDHGVARGELPGNVDSELAHELLLGPVYYRLLLTGDPLDDALAARIVDTTLLVLRS